MPIGIGAILENERRARWAILERDLTRQLWIPLHSLDSISQPRFVGADTDPCGWRFETLRAGWARWLDGIGRPLPPICLAVRPDGALRIADGHHRLTTARELGMPLPVMPIADAGPFPPLFGWRISDDAAELQTLAPADLVTRMHAPSEAEATAFRDTLVACIVRRQSKTGEDFPTAARGMFSTEGHGLAVKFDSSYSDPALVIRDLVLGLHQLPATIQNCFLFVMAHQPPDETRRAHYAKRAIPLLSRTRHALDQLIGALEGER